MPPHHSDGSPPRSGHGVHSATAATRDFLHRHPHSGHVLHSALHVAYFLGVAVSNFGKFYGLAAGLLAAIGAVAMVRRTAQ